MGKIESTMGSVERVEAVLRGEIPDRVPVDLHNFLMAAQLSGLPFSEFLQNGEVMAEAQLALWREFGHDVLILENGTTALAEACGCSVEYLAHSAPVLIEPVLKSLNELDQLQVPDIYQAHSLKENLKTTQIVAKATGNQAYIIGRADQGPFSLASMLLGVENFLMALMDPDQHARLHTLLEFASEVVYRYAVAQIEHGANMTSIGESLSGPDVTSPRIYRAFAWEYVCRLVTRLKTHHIPLAYHICGNATRIAGDMADTGAAVLELDYKCDLPIIKAATRGKTTILGVVDPSEILARGTPDQVIQEARNELNILGPGGGFILGPGCALPPTTPFENVHALIEAGHKYGCYTPDGQLKPA